MSPQRTNFNVSPYYDDFDSNDNYYKVLYKPGFPIQARELTSSQSILQNQLEQFGNNIFKEKTIVSGGFHYNGSGSRQPYRGVKLQLKNFDIDISIYLNNFLNKKIRGLVSGVTATIKNVVLPEPGNLEVDNPILYVNYESADGTKSDRIFEDGEELICIDNVTYGNTTISAGTPFASLIQLNANISGSAYSINNGVVFVRGIFANVKNQTIILDYYKTNPSYKVGLQVSESVVDANQDNDLFDNAKGFSNYAAPGADRFKLDLKLVKKPLDGNLDLDFVPLTTIRNGVKQDTYEYTQYNVIRDYIAKRTFEESGNYAVKPFTVSVFNSLNDNLGNRGIYQKNSLTNEFNTPSDDLMAISISKGKVYVKGYDIENISEVIKDVEKPRDVGIQSSTSVEFEFGNLVTTNNTTGYPVQGGVISLMNDFNGTGTPIGSARVYSFNLKDGAYENDFTEWDLRLFDIQTYTKLTLNTTVSSTELPKGSYIVGKSSGASGYTVSAGDNTAVVNVTQTSGTFIKEEQLEINGSVTELSRSIKSVEVFDTKSILSFSQENTEITGNFKTDSSLKSFDMPNDIDEVTITARTAADGISTVSSGGQSFIGIKPGDIIGYGVGENKIFNKVKTITPSGTELTIERTDANGAYGNALPSSGITTSVKRYVPTLNKENGLFVKLPQNNISSISLDNSSLKTTKILTDVTVNSSGNATLALPSGFTGTFDSFDQEKYTAVQKSNGSIASLNSDTFTYDATAPSITDLTASQNHFFAVTLNKTGIRSKVKNYNRSQTETVTLSNTRSSGSNSSSSLNDGLTYDARYGLRVQDKEISLNKPDVSRVVAIYESRNSSAPTLDRVSFSSTVNVSTNAIIGENIINLEKSAVARIVEVIGSDILEVVYLSDASFSVGDQVEFEESEIKTNVAALTPGKYKDITNNFLLDKGQRNEYCDYSRIVRKDSVNIPSKQLKIIFDCYTVSNDEGDVFTALSYDENRYSRDIPLIDGRVRATDTLDFRPRVSDYDTSSSLSPFHFDSRIFDNSIKQFLVPAESSELGIEYYLPRIDRLSVNTNNNFEYVKGVSSLNPVAPSKSTDPGRMDIATINLPAYLYDPQDAFITYNDNRRYTMKDIGDIDDRLSQLEELTSLNLLELSAQSLSIHDSANRDRFKCGIFADPLNDYSFIDEERSKCNLDTGNLLPKSSEYTIELDIVRQSDNSLFDSNLKETGDQITLNYEEFPAIEQTIATDFENLNPFAVSVYEPTILIVPTVDFWSDGNQTILERNKTVLEKSRNVKIGGDDLELVTNLTIGDGGGEIITSRTSDVHKLSGSTKIKSKDTNTVTNYVGTTVIPFARSRTVFFEAKGFPGNNFIYPFLGQYKSPDISITPKLLQIRKDDGSDGSTGTFIVGEIVDIIEENAYGPSAPGWNVRNGKGTFKVCRPDHQSGPISNPTKTYITSPYDVNDRLSTTGYTQTTKTLNLDVLEAASNFKSDFGVDVTSGQSLGGRAPVGAKIVGRESGAVAYVKSNQLVSDIFGTVQGSFHIEQDRIPTGSRAFRLTTSQQNLYPEASTTSDIVLTETYFTSGGSRLNFTQTRNEIVTKTSLNFKVQNRVFSETIIENQRREPPYDNERDPLGQTFFIEESSKNPANANSEELQNSTDDLSDGVIVSSIDVWFRSAPTVPENTNFNTEQLKNLLGTGQRVTLQLVETIGDGRPGTKILAETTLEQYRKSSDGTLINNIKTSTDANSSAYTRFSLNRLVYLEPGKLYAFILKPGSSTDYEAYIATKDKANITGTQIYRNEHAVGSLYKSANGFEWERDPYSDLTFRINVCNFTSEQGVLYLNNQDLTSEALDPNPLEPTPRTGFVNITPIPSSNTSLINILKNGRTILGDGAISTYATADIVSTGSAVAGISTDNTGTNYITGTSLDTVAITGQGTGLKLSITASGAISNTTVAVAGTGYQVGDQVGITTSQGRDAIFTVSSTDGGINRLYLDNILGDIGFWTADKDLYYLNDSGVAVGLANTDIISDYTKFTSNQLAGNFIKVNHPAHGMHSRAGTDKVVLKNVIGNVNPTTLSAPVALSSSAIRVADASEFVEFEGYPVGYPAGSDTNYGYVKIGEEIIAINAVDTTANTLTIQRRGVDGTTASEHPIGSAVSKYELNNISLIRINKRKLTISFNGIDANSYYLEVDLSEKTEDGDTTVIALNRSSDGSSVSTLPKLSFINKEDGGGNQVSVTKNIVYSEASAQFAVLTPSGKSGSTTNANASIRTVTGRSIDGNETPYVDKGFESIGIGDNTVKVFDDVRILASRTIENTQLTNIVDNRSVSVSLNLSRSKQNALLSPILSKNLLQMQYKSYKLNSPISLNAYDSNSAIKVFSNPNDPHEFVYVSKLIKIENPADSLKVLVTAQVPPSSDFRVLYYIQRADSSEISQSFELFPGYDNLRNDEDGEGLTPIDLSKNSGRSDVLVTKLEKGFREYEFSIDGIDLFTAFKIKIVASGTNQAKYPIFEDVRAIAIR